jgi:UDP-N-acetylglucosamine 2-epimerase (non-hydrolysing)
MPEEINRRLVDQISDLLFTHSPEAEENLRAEGRPEHSIHFVGNVMIDSLMRWSARAGERRAWEEFDLREKEYGLVTLHRPRNVDSPDRLREILRVLEKVAERMPLLYPIHPRTRDRLAAMDLAPGSDRLRLVEPRRYLDFLSLQKGARFVLTDSGGVQEETTCWGVPCLTIRPNTERPITIERGTNRLVEPGEVPEAVDGILTGAPPEPRTPDLWDGRSAERIVEVLRRHDFSRPSEGLSR